MNVKLEKYFYQENTKRLFILRQISAKLPCLANNCIDCKN